MDTLSVSLSFVTFFAIGAGALLYHGGNSAPLTVAGALCLVAAATIFGVTRRRLLNRFEAEALALGLAPQKARKEARMAFSALLSVFKRS